VLRAQNKQGYAYQGNNWLRGADRRGDMIRGPWMSQGTRGFTIWFKEFEAASGLCQYESCFKDGAILTRLVLQKEQSRM
jgi:hypothetical protein